MSFKALACSCILAACTNSLVAQIVVEQVIEDIVEFVVANGSEDADYTDLADILFRYAEHPIDLNIAEEEVLMSLMFLNEIQIRNIIAHRNATGPFLDVAEVQSVEGIDQRTSLWLSQFVRVTTLNPDHRPLAPRSSTHDVIVRYGQVLQKQAGFRVKEDGSRAYAGSAGRLLFRYRGELGGALQISLNMEKDAGERLIRGGEGFDFYSGSVYYSGSRGLRKVVLGDYSLQFGQGLTMWSGLGFGKGSLISGVAKSGAGIRPYTSANESSFLRGMAGEWNKGRFRLIPFIAYNKLDASLSDDGAAIATIAGSGLHRTLSERANRNRLSRVMGGGNFQYRGNSFKLGVSAVYTSLSLPVEQAAEYYKRFVFSGDRATNYSLDYAYSARRAYVFGEWAYRADNGIALVNGLLSSPAPQFSIALLHRYYQPDFYSFLSQGFSESGSTANENGFYSGFAFKPHYNWEFIASADLFRFPWLRYRVHKPSVGAELSLQLNFYQSKRLKAGLRYKSQQKEENTATDVVAQVARRNLRMDFSYLLTSDLTIRTRCELSSYVKASAPREQGFLLYQDVIYKPMSSRLAGNFRIGFFDTGGFNSRIYTYENDVLYAYSMPALQHAGIRWYANIRWDVSRNLSMWMRYAHQSLTNQEQIGSANDLIEGNRRSDIKLQVRCRL